MPIDLSKIKNKLNPPPDGQDVLRLKVGVVSAIDSSTGSVTVTMNGVDIPSVPVLGSARFIVGASVQVLSYRGSLLVLGSSGAVASQPVQLTGSTTLGNTTSTSFVNSLTTTGVHGLAFVAPPSGRVDVVGRAGGGSATVGQYSLLDFEVRQGATPGSGTVFRAADNNTASVFMSSTSGGQGPLSFSTLVTGLTPGAVYNASLTYASSSGSSSATFNRRYISVRPK